MKETEEQKRIREQNEKEQIVKIYKEYIIKNISKLEEWSKLKFNKIIYDSEIDGKSNKVFKNKILNHSNLYFIIIDSNFNVFGHYHNGIINIIITHIYEPKIFIFSLKLDGKSEIKKYERKRNLYTFIYDGKKSARQFYKCGNDENNNDSYGIDKIEDNYGIIQNVQNNFKEMKSTDLTGNDCSEQSGRRFNPKRLIVIEMKETEEQKRIREEKEIQMIEKAYKERIINNIPILEEWSELKYNQILYDSEIDGKSNEIFRNKIMNHSHLYFIVIDSNDNVFWSLS